MRGIFGTCEGGHGVAVHLRVQKTAVHASDAWDRLTRRRTDTRRRGGGARGRPGTGRGDTSPEGGSGQRGGGHPAQSMLMRAKTSISRSIVDCVPRIVRFRSWGVCGAAIRVPVPLRIFSTEFSCRCAYLIRCEGLRRPSRAHLGLPHARSVPACIRCTIIPHVPHAKNSLWRRGAYDFSFWPFEIPGRSTYLHVGSDAQRAG